MKLQHYALIFLVLILGTVISLFTATHQNHKTMVESEDVEFEVTSSLLDAMNDVSKLSADSNYLFNNKNKRQTAYDSFFDTLSLNLQHYVTKDEYVKDSIPCLFMVDTDGFYIAYQENVNGMYCENITPINTWSEEVANNLFVRYYLNNYVKITNTDVTHYGGINEYKGTVEDVYAELSSGLKSHLSSYLADYQTYCSKREDYIAKRMEEEANYYINLYNVNDDYNYDIEIPHSLYLNYGRQIDRPCMFAFAQGEYYGLVGTDANIFAFANSEVIDSATFYMYKATVMSANGSLNSEMYYHSKKTCGNINGEFYGKGNISECASQGFSPCPYCIN